MTEAKAAASSMAHDWAASISSFGSMVRQILNDLVPQNLQFLLDIVAVKELSKVVLTLTSSRTPLVKEPLVVRWAFLRLCTTLL